MSNETLSDGSVAAVNHSVLSAQPTELRGHPTYVQYYTLLANFVCVMFIPTAVMAVCTVLIIRQMIGQQPTALRYTSAQVRKQMIRTCLSFVLGALHKFVCTVNKKLGF